MAHVLYMLAATLGARIWSEYVRTKANVADEPSRVDLTGILYRRGHAGGSRRGAPQCASRCDTPGAGGRLGTAARELAHGVSMSG